MRTLTAQTFFSGRILSFLFLFALVFGWFDVSSASAVITKAECEAVAGQTCAAAGLANRESTGNNCTYQPSGSTAFTTGVCYKAVATVACTALNPAGVCKASCSANGDTAGNGTCSDPAKPLCCISSTTTACASPNNCDASCADATKYSPTPVSGTCSDAAKPLCCAPKSVGGDYIPSNNTVSFGNPLQYNTVQDVLGGLLSALQGIIVILSIIFIVIGAVLYITSGGNSKQVESAKSAITASMIGLAIGIAAPSFLKEISGILGWNAAPANVSGAISLTQILTNVLTFLTGIVGILSIIMLVIGSLMILSSAGSEDRIDDGKKIVKYSVIGIVVAFAALVIVKQVAALFVV